MKKILHVLSQRPSRTGSGVYLENIIREAHEKGYEQGAIVGLSQEENEWTLEEIQVEARFPVYFNTKELPFDIVGMSDEMPYTSTRYQDMTPEMLSNYRQAFTKTIDHALERFKPDIIVSHHLWLLTGILKERVANHHGLKTPVIGICHGTDLRQHHLATNLSNEVTTKVSAIDQVFALHQEQINMIKVRYKITEDAIHLMGNGYNSRVFHAKHDKNLCKDKKRIVYAGKLSFAKGVRELIHAINGIQSKNFELVLAGSGQGHEYEEILKLVQISKTKIRYVGMLNQFELAELFRCSDVFVLPSYYEGLPLVVLEALACGLSVVVSDLPGLKPWLSNQLEKDVPITYVTLPKLMTVDVPYPDSIGYYIQDLRSALEAQLESNDAECVVTLNHLSWHALFERIEKVFNGLL